MKFRKGEDHPIPEESKQPHAGDRFLTWLQPVTISKEEERISKRVEWCLQKLRGENA